MFSRQYNQMRIDLSIEPRAPLLIRSGRTGASPDPTRPDLECVRTRFNGVRSVYIPGSSLKGVLRSHAERLMLSEGLPITPTFSERAVKAFDQKTPGDVAYAGTCPLGRTFGSLHVKGRVSVTDHLPGGREKKASERDRLIQQANATEQRNGVGIDRLLGSAKRGALFDQEVVVQGRFDGGILFRNFQLYQLALILLVLRDLNEGYVQLGSGTTRGNGLVSARIEEIRIETRRDKTPSGSLVGLGRLSPEKDRYQLFEDDEIALPEGLKSKTELVWDQIRVPFESVNSLAEALVQGPWLRFLDQARKRQFRA